MPEARWLSHRSSFFKKIGHVDVVPWHQWARELELAGEAARWARGVVWGAGIHSVTARFAKPCL
jgi:hypothetical protein